jgi:hypothetical protein
MRQRQRGRGPGCSPTESHRRVTLVARLEHLEGLDGKRIALTTCDRAILAQLVTAPGEAGVMTEGFDNRVGRTAVAGGRDLLGRKRRELRVREAGP